MTTKKRRGAPKKANPASARFEVRCTPEQKARWSSAAARSGMSLSEWLKGLADKNVQPRNSERPGAEEGGKNNQ